MDDIEQQKAALLAAVATADPVALEAVRVGALGKSGTITALLKTMGRLTPEERQAQGPRIHGLREAVTAAIADRKAMLEAQALDARLATERLDMTLPVAAAPAGSVHPVAQVMDELAEIFADLGFAVATGPEIEDDWHNFTALNIPETHPARAMHDTFYVERVEQAGAPARPAGDGHGPASDGGFAAGAGQKAERDGPLAEGSGAGQSPSSDGAQGAAGRTERAGQSPSSDGAQGAAGRAERDGQSPSSDGAGSAPPAGAADAGSRMLLRTHTSPVQIRTMLSQQPPIRIIAPGRTYRSDSDATHTPMFHQVEGLVIDRGITMGHLKWTLETFVKAYFERDDIVLRMRPSYFPFTEPSAEVDVGFTWVKGKRVIGGGGDAAGGGWMEILGSGMVHPRVIAACGLDPAEWQGFAFGCGIDRLAMLKYGMDDLRPFFDGDLRWLRHYGFAALDMPTLSGGISAGGISA